MFCQITLEFYGTSRFSALFISDAGAGLYNVNIVVNYRCILLVGLYRLFDRALMKSFRKRK